MKITATPLATGINLQNTHKSPAARRVTTADVPLAEPAGPISQAQQALRDMPDADTLRVAELKAAIQDGKLDLDAASLSRSMMDYYRR